MFSIAHAVLRHAINERSTFDERNKIFKENTIQGRNNWVQYNGNYYSTLTDVPINSQYHCQDKSLTLPTYWVIAPNTDASNRVASNYWWGADCVLVEDGYDYVGYSNPYYYNQCSLVIVLQANNSYTTSSSKTCSQILIMCKYKIHHT